MLLADIHLILRWIEDSALAAAIRQSAWLYPALEIAHIVGIVLLAGSAFLFDLRLLGFSTQVSVLALAKLALPWSRRGLWLVVPSGLLLFITNAAALAHSPVFWLKMLLLLFAGGNALLFHYFTLISLGKLDAQAPLPWRAKAAAVFSILVWIGVIACGRLLAYQ